MMLVGLTGGIATGKTTIAAFFSQLGVPCIDADRLAYELCVKPQPAYQAILNHFGRKILLDNGELDRKKIAGIIFSDKKEKQWLESLLHPLILSEIKQKIADLHSEYALIIIPLLFETGPYSFLDRTLIVDVPETVQIKRLMTRDALSEEEAKRRIAQQMPRDKKIQQADDKIINEGGEETLKGFVYQLHKKYLMMAKMINNERFDHG